MKAVVVESPGKLHCRDIAVPKPGAYEALVRMELCAICNSTDTKLKDGRFPGFRQYPATLGHEGIGTVMAVGDKVKTFKLGDRVLNPCTLRTGVAGLASGWGTMAEFALAGDHRTMKADGVCDAAHEWDGVFQTQKVIPADISNGQAILLSTWREVWSSFADFGFQPGQSLLIIGGGPVGLSFVLLAKAFGMGRVCLSTRSQWKLERAAALGADAVLPAGEGLVAAARQLQPDGFDFVLDAVGAASVMNQALRLIRFDGVIGVYGTVSEEALGLEKKEAPYNWRLIMHQWPDYSKEAAAHEPLCELIRQGKLNADAFITHEFCLDEVADGFAAVEENTALKVLLHVRPAHRSGPTPNR